MLIALITRLLVTGVAFAAAARLLSGMDVTGGFWGYVWIAVIFGVVNAIIGSVLRVLAFPLTLLTLGLFGIVVNAILLEITDGLSDHLTIDKFWWTAIWAAIIISAVSVALEIVIGPRRRRGARSRR